MNVEALVGGIRAGERRSLARAITLVESDLPQHRVDTLRLLSQCKPFWKRGLRLGVSGSPGAGKSTLIEALGSLWLAQEGALSVLAVDPSSSQSGGSVLGDKTRMSALSRSRSAFVRPSPTGAYGDSIPSACADAVFLCECAGFSPCLVETVGVGQSETTIANIVDLLVVVLEPGAGDELQGIKRGLLEWADFVAVNKADGGRRTLALQTAREYQAALSLMRSPPDAPLVVAVSASTQEGVAELLELIQMRYEELSRSGEIAKRRAEGGVRELQRRLRSRLLERFLGASERRRTLEKLSSQVQADQVLPAEAVAQLLGETEES